MAEMYQWYDNTTLKKHMLECFSQDWKEGSFLSSTFHLDTSASVVVANNFLFVIYSKKPGKYQYGSSSALVNSATNPLKPISTDPTYVCEPCLANNILKLHYPLSTKPE